MTSVRTMRAADRKLPDFIAVGPPRTATSWLDRVLRGHVSLPEGLKETKFFTENFSRGLDWYEYHFRNSVAGRPIGEVSTPYFASALARERIAAIIPGCAIICTLRDPVARLYSHYRNQRAMGRIGAVSLDEVIAGHRNSLRPAHIFDTSTYSKHLRLWYDKFGKENVLTLINDDLVSDPQRYIDQVCRFVGIPPIDMSRSALRDARVNQRWRAPRSAWLARRARELRDVMRYQHRYALARRLQPVWKFCFGGGAEFGPLDPAVEASLRAYFRPDLDALEELLHRDLSAWK